jgi:hypothetical protein
MRLGRAERELVHVHLSLAILDHIVGMKVQSLSGTFVLGAQKSAHICLIKKDLSISIYSSIIHMSNNLVDLELCDAFQHLNNKYVWLQAPDAEWEALRQETGTIFTAFDRLPGWYGIDNCPINAMHLFHLGTMKHICQTILIKAGLLHPLYHGQPTEDQPFECIDSFISHTVFPSFCQWKPPKVSCLN